MTNTLILNINTATQAELVSAARRIREGAVVVFPTDTVYGIGACVANTAAIDRIYIIKERTRAKPLPLFAHSLAGARELVQFTPQAEKLASRFWPGKLTLILPPLPDKAAFAHGEKGIGVRVPGLARLRNWLVYIGEPLAQTSANLSGSPALTSEAAVIEQFIGKADIIITGGELCGSESTVADLTCPTPSVLREGAVSAKDFFAALQP